MIVNITSTMLNKPKWAASIKEMLDNTIQAYSLKKDKPGRLILFDKEYEKVKLKVEVILNAKIPDNVELYYREYKLVSKSSITTQKHRACG